MQWNRYLGAGVICCLVVLVGVGLWKTAGPRRPARLPVVRSCQGVMGTSCSMAMLVEPHRHEQAEGVLQQAEAVLRNCEARLSTWIDDSETGRLNAAEAGREVSLSAETLDVLRIAQRAAEQTDGAFDVTCRPVIELWRDAAQRGAEPSQDEIAAARASSNWETIQLGDTGAVKLAATARVDLGGIAKGYAVDRVVELLRGAGIPGGMIDVGGDLVCFGPPPVGDAWTVDVQNPFGPGLLTTLRLTGGAVCTSGNYVRFFEIGGKRYSHIIDPRTGRPTETTHAVTVVAGDAVTADIWATALSVLGPDGLERLPEGVDAMIVGGSERDHQIVCTNGFRRLLEAPLPAGLVVE